MTGQIRKIGDFFVLTWLIFEGPVILNLLFHGVAFLYDIEIALPLRASCSCLPAMLDVIYKHVHLTVSTNNQQYIMRLIKCMHLITMCA